MNTVVGFGLTGFGVIAFWAAMIGTRLERPPRWMSDTMIMAFIAPMIIIFWVGGISLSVYEIVKGSLSRLQAADLIDFGAVLATLVLLGMLVARWSRRAPRRQMAEVISLQQPDLPDPVRPKPMSNTSLRKAA